MMPNTSASTARIAPNSTMNGIQAIARPIEPMTTAAVAIPFLALAAPDVWPGPVPNGSTYR